MRWWIPTGERTIVDVRLERHQGTIAIDALVKDGGMLQRVLPVPDALASVVLPEVSVGAGGILLSWPLLCDEQRVPQRAARRLRDDLRMSAA